MSDSVVRWLCRPNLALFNQPPGAFRLHPDVLMGVLILIGIYLVSVSYLQRRSGVKPDNKHYIYLFLAVFVLLVAEVSPLHDIAEGFLFSAHMLQHLLLVFLLPPFLLKSIPEGMLQPLFRTKTRRRIGKLLTNPIFAIFLGNAIYTIWHMPLAYQAALFKHEIHILEHVMMVTSAILMWWPIFSPDKQLPKLSPPAKVAYLFFMSLAQIGVFAYVTFANKVLYPFYATAPRLWDMSVEVDQVLAGVVMKLGMMIVIVPILATIFFRWARQDQAGDSATTDGFAREAG